MKCPKYKTGYGCTDEAYPNQKCPDHTTFDCRIKKPTIKIDNRNAALIEIREYCSAKRLIIMEREQLEEYCDESGNKVKEDIEAILARYGL